jgi:2-methylisocitrate lyase-like PEP mutase family enzyme
MTGLAGPAGQDPAEIRRRQFAALHRRGSPFLLPNAWDVASALLLADAGFPAIGTTSLGVTAAVGLVDGSGTGRAYTLALAAALPARVGVPVTVDIEGGYSDDPGAVAELAAEVASFGVAGINLEDATAGRLRTAADQAAIIRAVVAAAPGIFVNARTDTYWLRAGDPGQRRPDTISRLLAYQDAGASGAFVPAMTGQAAIEAVTARVNLPLNLLWHPAVNWAELAAAGVARVSTGSAPYRRALAAGLATAIAARDGGQPPGEDVSYDRLMQLLRPATDVAGVADAAGGPVADPTAESSTR